MCKKITKLLGTALIVITLMSFALPLYSTYIESGESCHLALRGINVVEFSAWGSLTVIIPLLIVGIMYSKLCDKAKMLLNMMLCVLGTVSFYNAVYSTREWVYYAATNHVTHGIFPIVYGSAFLFATISFHIHCIAKEKNKHSVKDDEYQMLL